MRSKKLGIGLLLLLAVAVTTGTFAYWASSVSGDSDVVAASVTIGSGSAVTTTITVGDLADSSALVPTAHAATPGTEDTVALTMSVAWAADADGAAAIDGTLGVTIDSYTLGTLTEAQIDAMFSISVTSGTGAIVEGTPQNVVVTIVFQNEPGTKAIYDEVALGTLALSLTFDITTP